MVWIKSIFGLCLVFSCAGSLVMAQSSNSFVEPIKNLAQFNDDLHLDTQRIKTYHTELENLGNIIFELKQASNPNLIQKLTLEKHMQEAQALSKQLLDAQAKLDHKKKHLIRKKQNLLDRIEGLLASSESKNRDMVQQLIASHQKASSIGQNMTFKPSHKKHTLQPTLKSEGPMEPEYILVLKDLATYTEDLIKQTGNALSRYKQRHMLETELTHLMNEEVFFGEQGFIQISPRKSSSPDANPNQPVLGAAADTSKNDSELDENLPEIVSVDPSIDDQSGIPGNVVPTLEPDTLPGVADPNLDSTPLPGLEGISLEAGLNIDQPLNSLIDFDTKINTLVMDSVDPLNELSTTDKAAPSPDSPFETPTKKFFENPHLVSNAIESFKPFDNETDEAFLHRKNKYLKQMLSKIKSAIDRLERPLNTKTP